jgi:hypothetical protein
MIQSKISYNAILTITHASFLRITPFVQCYKLWKDRVFAIQAKTRWLEQQRQRFMCERKSKATSLSHPNLF